jgi:hypothetical protein
MLICGEAIAGLPSKTLPAHSLGRAIESAGGFPEARLPRLCSVGQGDWWHCLLATLRAVLMAGRASAKSVG